MFSLWENGSIVMNAFKVFLSSFRVEFRRKCHLNNTIAMRNANVKAPFYLPFRFQYFRIDFLRCKSGCGSYFSINFKMNSHIQIRVKHWQEKTSITKTLIVILNENHLIITWKTSSCGPFVYLFKCNHFYFSSCSSFWNSPRYIVPIYVFIV